MTERTRPRRGNAAHTDENHNAALSDFYLTFGDVTPTDLAIACLKRNAGKGLVAPSRLALQDILHQDIVSFGTK